MSEKEARRIQQEAAQEFGIPVTSSLDLKNGVKIELVLIPPGEGMIGNKHTILETRRKFGGKREWLADEYPLHRVSFDRPFYIGRFEITQAQWKAVMGENPAFFRAGDGQPVEQVSWLDATKFCRALSKMTGRTVRLPSEAEWEYACRAGSEGDFSFHDSSKLEDHGWLAKNSQVRTHEVGKKPPNRWGLHDVHGNVSEWCQDPWKDTYENATLNGSKETTDGDPEVRAVRGGGWFDPKVQCRSSSRAPYSRRHRYSYVGFRVVVEPPNEKAKSH
jgi:formylglycine-generating enzyme required for sulfatase activity